MTTIKIRDFIRLIRLETIFWFCITTCYGFASIILGKPPPVHFAFLVLTIAFANIGAIIVNDIGDVEVDRKSNELSKRTRPLVTNAITIKAARIIAFSFYLLSILTSFLYGISATLFAVVIILFSLAYSLPPFRFCARPYGSIVYWIVLCAVCYFLMAVSLENIHEPFSLIYTGTVGTSPQALGFILGIILFMGIAEIIAKDIRDKINDAEGGRNTFVNFAGINRATMLLLFCAWSGFALWMGSLYLSGVFRTSLFAWLC
ncbi:MAG: UbiA family prenyltransferase, partial [Taibaiella sp.]|nr:UbiA family prenyltransferase [Taibaiella sp.]